MKLLNNTVLITGGATGIGYALAEYFLEKGSTVIICGRREKKLLEAKKKQPKLHTHVCDVSQEEDRKILLSWIVQNYPDLNILINNAGIQRDIDFTNGIEDFLSGENEIRINLESTIILTGLFLPILKKNNESAIINVSSGLGFIPAVKMPVYSASKAGVHAFTMAIRQQLSKVGIKVFEIVPPAVDTDLNPQGRAMRGNFKVNLSAKEFVSAVMRAIKEEVIEIGYKTTAGLIHASRAELDESFIQMNNRM